MGTSNVTAKAEMITPKKAKLYLESNTNNRRVRQKTVDFYSRVMASGQWLLNGKTIVISDEGVILDGQHRLLACIDSGSSFESIVVRGPHDDVFPTIDQGVIRTGGDIVGREGFGQATRKAAAARVLLAMQDQEEGSSEAGYKPALGLKRPHLDILECVTGHDEIFTEGCQMVNQDDGKTILKPAAVFVSLYAFFALKNRKKAKEFFTQLTSGEDLNKRDPAYKLRGTLLGALNIAGVRRKKTWVLAVTIKAWNAFLQGKTVGQLKFSDSEKWPKTRARR